MKVNSIKHYLLKLQQRICSTLEQEESSGKRFFKDQWHNADRGEGLSCVLEEGDVIERAGVNFSLVQGDHLPVAATAAHPELAGRRFKALGISVIVHPYNPHAPTTHANVRFFIAEEAGKPSIWWFGGGFDLTPYYGYEEDCLSWHQAAQAACAPFGNDVYPEFKKAADDYFYLRHRNEHRGIGGLFFDDLNRWSFEASFAFMRNVGDGFINAYQPILARRKHIPFGASERQFQCYRRGRYAEFNLVYDRGTRFGLQFKGRIESILVSMPPVVHWKYDWQPTPGSPEAKLYSHFLVPRDWLAITEDTL